MKVSSIILPASGLILGAGAGYLIGARVTARKIQSKADAEIESVKALYEERLNQVTQRVNVPEEKVEKKSSKKKKEVELPEKKELTNEEKESVKKYSSMYKQKEEIPNEVHEELMRQPEIKTEDIVYYISDVEYAGSTFNAMDLTYYNDGVVCDGDNNELLPDDVYNYVGDLLSASVFESTDVVYIRNDARELDFCVTKDERNFSDLRRTTAPGEK